MDFNAVRMFVAVVQTGSLSAAAGRLDMPLPTLSRRIKHLEQELAVQLLERSVQGTKLTDAGSRLYESACTGVESLLEAEQTLKMDQALLRGRLRLSIPQTFEPWWALLADFQRQYPDIHIQVSTTERRVDLVEEGIDVALRVGSIAHDNLVARHYLNIHPTLVASPELLKELGTPKTPVDLLDKPCAAWSSIVGSTIRWRFGDQVIEPRAALSVNDYQHLRFRALAGDFYTELPSFLAAPYIRERKLVPLLADHPMPEVPVHLVYPQHRHPSTIVRTYLRFCQDYLPTIAEEFRIAIGRT